MKTHILRTDKGLNFLTAELKKTFKTVKCGKKRQDRSGGEVDFHPGMEFSVDLRMKKSEMYFIL